MSWIALRITPASNREGVIAALFEAGSQGVQEDGASVVTHFPGDAPIDAIRRALYHADPAADISVAGQLAPGDTISFSVCSPREALAALIAQERALMAVEASAAS